MGLETSVDFFKDKSTRWYQFRKIWDACNESGIEPPDEIIEFFDNEYPDENVPGEPAFSESEAALSSFENENEKGYTIDLKLLPKEVRFVRVCIS